MLEVANHEEPVLCAAIDGPSPGLVPLPRGRVLKLGEPMVVEGRARAVRTGRGAERSANVAVFGLDPDQIVALIASADEAGHAGQSTLAQRPPRTAAALVSHEPCAAARASI